MRNSVVRSSSSQIFIKNPFSPYSSQLSDSFLFPSTSFSSSSSPSPSSLLCFLTFVSRRNEHGVVFSSSSSSFPLPLLTTRSGRIPSTKISSTLSFLFKKVEALSRDSGEWTSPHSYLVDVDKTPPRHENSTRKCQSGADGVTATERASWEAL